MWSSLSSLLGVSVLRQSSMILTYVVVVGAMYVAVVSDMERIEEQYVVAAAT
jgi:hypothetical protein